MTIWIVLFLGSFEAAFFTEQEALDYIPDPEHIPGFSIREYCIVKTNVLC